MTDTVEHLLQAARRRLAAAPFKPSIREANLLLGHVLGSDEAHLLAHTERQVDPESVSRFLKLLNRRIKGEPVAYLFGEREFFGRPFTVDRRVLIPRPETEHLVETALGLNFPPRPRILELGTGSGCVAITLALELSEARVIATDISPAALAVAAVNIARHQIVRSVFPVITDLAAAVRIEAVDLVVANLPYIAEEDARTLSTEVRDHEPSAALFAHDSGLRLILDSLRQLTSLPCRTPVLLEVGAGQAAQLEPVVGGLGYLLTAIHTDYAGIPRILALERR